uniref:Uncharacterized protein n=1 Tax=uncultured bacterium contig00036 TaxID=1181524 RepID=A0A806KMB8_9BACT|nr:hypothetical protein [uncultured bacterium contig00036]
MNGTDLAFLSVVSYLMNADEAIRMPLNADFSSSKALNC